MQVPKKDKGMLGKSKKEDLLDFKPKMTSSIEGKIMKFKKIVGDIDIPIAKTELI